ncbi:hypothetical protein M9H77_15022 [Catharanthus roseus]|uniref:Uncharacterized protein n=1 Tax=Catharanthus roseus TaxID=4058 RepID=A0ACC0BPV8_CATRO|nr:hypothetical protein M9H77_15022 [Catharanthus roseus]
MAASLPVKTYRFPLTNWEFSLNQGPFSIKEHVLITIFASNGATSAYALGIITIVLAFYHGSLNALASFSWSKLAWEDDHKYPSTTYIYEYIIFLVVVFIWTCPGDSAFYSASIIWGVIGPKRMFTKGGIYPELNWFFLIAALAPIPVYLLSRKFPEKKWIQLINMPLIFGATATVGIFFNVKYKKWWAKHAYVLGAALDAGLAFLAMLLYFAIQSRIDGPGWWGLEVDDHCPLVTCPTAPGVVVDGCPVF